MALAARGAAGRVIGSLELIRIAEPFDDESTAVAELAVAQLALTIRTLGPETGSDLAGRRAKWLELAGDALVAGGDAGRVAQQTVRAAVEATGAQGGTLWRTASPGQVELIASVGADSGLDEAVGLVRSAIATWRPVAIEEHPALPGNATCAATLSLGQPAFGVLQLYFLDETMPPEHELPALAAFAARAAHALRAGEHASAVEEELVRTRALLEVVGAAIARLSLAHTLETAVERISELLDVEQVGVYLREDGQLLAAAGRGLAVGHEEVAARLLEVALGPLRARAAVHADVADDEPALAGPRAALAAAGQRSVLAVPLHVRDDSIGLLVTYPGARRLGESDISLLTSLAAQLAVAVQNARLHERSKELGEALGEVLATERQASRQVNALYEISRSFAQSLSLDTTLDAVTATIVAVLDVDAAVIRVPDERGDQFTPRAVHVADTRLAKAVRTILERPQRRPARSQEPVLLDARRLRASAAPMHC